jgi:hypothetical protein
MKNIYLLHVMRLVAYLLALFWAGQSVATTYMNGNFTMIDSGGTTFGGSNDIAATWDDSLNTIVNSTNFNMTMGSESDFLFFGFPWSAHHIRVFGPGSYSFDTTCSVTEVESGIAICGGGVGDYLDLIVGTDQVGTHILWDWNVEENIDIAVLWDTNDVFDSTAPHNIYQGPAGTPPALDTVFDLVSVDGDGDGIPGLLMIDGSFIDFSANFSLQAVPIPPALWLFGSGLLGLVGMARRKKAA